MQNYSYHLERAHGRTKSRMRSWFAENEPKFTLVWESKFHHLNGDEYYAIIYQSEGSISTLDEINMALGREIGDLYSTHFTDVTDKHRRSVK
jgi:hypothetical protein